MQSADRFHLQATKSNDSGLSTDGIATDLESMPPFSALFFPLTVNFVRKAPGKEEVVQSLSA